MNEELTRIGIIIAGVAVMWLLKVIITLAKAQIERIQNETVRELVRDLVLAVEEACRNLSGADKQAWVIEQAKARGYEITPEEIDAAVRVMKAAGQDRPKIADTEPD